jgi:hypothetical protein
MMCKEAVVAYFEILSTSFSGGTWEATKTSVRITSFRAETRTRYFPHTKQGCNLLNDTFSVALLVHEFVLWTQHLVGTYYSQSDCEKVDEERHDSPMYTFSK